MTGVSDRHLHGGDGDCNMESEHASNIDGGGGGSSRSKERGLRAWGVKGGAVGLDVCSFRRRRQDGVGRKCTNSVRSRHERKS